MAPFGKECGRLSGGRTPPGQRSFAFAWGFSRGILSMKPIFTVRLRSPADALTSPAGIGQRGNRRDARKRSRHRHRRFGLGLFGANPLADGESLGRRLARRRPVRHLPFAPKLSPGGGRLFAVWDEFRPLPSSGGRKSAKVPPYVRKALIRRPGARKAARKAFCKAPHIGAAPFSFGRKSGFVRLQSAKTARCRAFACAAKVFRMRSWESWRARRSRRLLPRIRGGIPAVSGFFLRESGS